MNKYFVMVLLLAAGCVNQDYAYDYDRVDPDEFRCPSGYIAWCEGHLRSNMECSCLDEDETARMADQLRRMIY
jgi:hypothetical protein